MTDAHDKVLNPVGAVLLRADAASARTRNAGGKMTIGLLDNSKPNVGLFLSAFEAELRRSGAYEIVNVTKPRSAAPSPDLALLAARCDFVVNAVAD